MSTVIEVGRGRDGKLYSARPLDEAGLRRARSLAHALVHRDKMSMRAAQQVMADSYGLRRSIGIIARDLALWTCQWCPDRSAEPEPITQPAAAMHSSVSGLAAGLHG